MKKIILSIFFLVYCTSALAKDPVPVTVLPLQKISTPIQGQAPATGQSLNHSLLSAEINARILEVDARVGDQLIKGALLASLDCSDYQQIKNQADAQVKSMRSRRKLSDWQLERTRSLAKKNTVSEELLLKRSIEASIAKSDFDIQRSLQKTAAHNVARCQIRAPYTGIVTERLAQVGELASPGKPMFRFLDSENLEVSSKISATIAASIETASKLEFIYQDQSYPLKLRTLSAAIDANSHTRDARLEFLEQKPLPGSSGRVVWVGKSNAIPADYLQRRNGVLGVFTAVSNRAKFHALAKAKEGRAAESTLPANTQIITDGRLGLVDGDVISISKIASN